MGKDLGMKTILVLLMGVAGVVQATTASVSVSVPCCRGENVIRNRRCVDGSNVTALTCGSKYLQKASERKVNVDVDGFLVINGQAIPNDRYCVTQIGNISEDFYLVCFDHSDQDPDWQFLLYGVLELISVIFILITIAVYLQITDILDLQGICILHSISGLAIAFLVLGINQLTTEQGNGSCLASAYIIYFGSLYAFFWLNALAFHIWRTIVKPKCFNFHKYWTYIYHAYGIGGSLTMLSVLLVAHHAAISHNSEMHPGLGEGKCWFKSTKTQFVFFYAPLSVLICLNIIYYGWTIAILWKDLAKCDEKKTKVVKFRLMLCVKLFFVMGIPWVFEVLSAILQDSNYQILKNIMVATDCLNAMQGILIFLLLVVFRKRVVRGLASRSFCGFRLPGEWRTLQDDECDEIEEELGLSETNVDKVNK